MSIEQTLVLQVGDALPSVKATASIVCTDANLGAAETLTVTPAPTDLVPAPVPVVFTQGVDFNGGSGDNDLAAEIQALINAVTGLNATVLNNIVSIEVVDPGLLGNNWILATDSTAFSLTQFNGGKDENQNTELRLELDSDGLVTAKVGEVDVFNVPYRELLSPNLKTFEVNLKEFLKKSQC